MKFRLIGVPSARSLFATFFISASLLNISRGIAEKVLERFRYLRT